MNDEMLMVAARLIPIADLRPNPTNARTHPDDQVAQIASSIREFGFTKAAQFCGFCAKSTQPKRKNWPTKNAQIRRSR